MEGLEVRVTRPRQVRCQAARLPLFGSSGTTVIACEKSGRLAGLIELKPKYRDVIVGGWQAFTGRQALSDGDGRTFTEVARGRQQGAA